MQCSFRQQNENSVYAGNIFYGLVILLLVRAMLHADYLFVWILFTLWNFPVACLLERCMENALYIDDDDDEAHDDDACNGIVICSGNNMDSVLPKEIENRKL